MMMLLMVHGGDVDVDNADDGSDDSDEDDDDDYDDDDDADDDDDDDDGDCDDADDGNKKEYVAFTQLWNIFFLTGKSTISTVIFNRYVKLPEGIGQ